MRDVLIHGANCSVSKEFQEGVDGRVRPGGEVLLLMSCRGDVMSALSHEYITRRGRLSLRGWIKESAKTESWSPSPGMTLQRCTRDGLFVKNKSKILSPLVGVCTSCSSPLSPGMFKYSVVILLGY